MDRKLRSVCAVIGFALVLSLMTGIANAQYFIVDDQDIRLQYRPLNLIAGGLTTSCPVTMSGSLHNRVIEKVSGSLVGHVTRVTTANGSCTGAPRAAIVPLTGTLPWHIVYDAFTGRLPAIQTIRLLIVGVSFMADPPESSAVCLAETTQEAPAKGDLSLDSISGKLDNYILDSDHEIPMDDELSSTTCDVLNILGRASGSGAVDDGAGGLILIRLI